MSSTVITVVAKIEMYDLPFLNEFSEWYINHVEVDNIIFLYKRMPLVLNVASYINSREGRVHLFEMKSDLDINLSISPRLSDDFHKILKNTTNADWMVYVKPFQLLQVNDLHKVLSRNNNIVYSVPVYNVKLSDTLYGSFNNRVASIAPNNSQPVIINLNFQGTPAIDIIPLSSQKQLFNISRRSIALELLCELEKERNENRYPSIIERILLDDTRPISCKILNDIKEETETREQISIPYNLLTDTTDNEMRFIAEVIEGLTGREVKDSDRVVNNIKYQFANASQYKPFPTINNAIAIYNNKTVEKEGNAQRYTSQEVKSHINILLKDRALNKREPKDIVSFLRVSDNQKIIMKIDNEQFIQIDTNCIADMPKLKDIILTRETTKEDIHPIPQDITTFYTDTVCNEVKTTATSGEQIPGVRDILIINLEECKQRQVYMSLIFKEMNLNHSFYIVNRPTEEIYAKYLEWFNTMSNFAIKQEVFKNINLSTVSLDLLFQMILPYKLTRSEFGVNTSHTHILNKIKNDTSLGDEEGYIICEDDIVISRDFKERATRLIQKRPKGIEILVLGYIDYDLSKRDVLSDYYMPKSGDKLTYGCQCYYVTKRGAEIFYKLSSDYSTVVDWHWLYLGAHLNVLALASVPLALNNYSDSNIQEKSGLGRFSSYLNQCRSISEYNYLPLGVMSQPFFIKWYNNVLTQHRLGNYESFVRYLESKENQSSNKEEMVWFDIFESSFKNLQWKDPLKKIKILMAATNPERHNGRQVDFLIVGAHRSGISSLSKMLIFSKDIYIPYNYSNGRTKYFEEEELYSKGIEYYHSHFISDRKLCGEAIPTAYVYPETLLRIKEYNPAIKLIMLLREPVNRVYSHWYTIKDKENIKFEDFLERERQSNQATSALKQGCYIEQINFMYETFGKDRVKILVSEYLKQVPSHYKREICKFFSIDEFYAKYTKENITSYTTGMSKQTFKNLHAYYKPYNEALYRLLGIKVELWEKFYELNLM